MRYIVKGKTKAMGQVQVIARNAPHAIEAAQRMLDQDLREIVVQDMQSAQETTIEDFLLALAAGEMDRANP